MRQKLQYLRFIISWKISRELIFENHQFWKFRGNWFSRIDIFGCQIGNFISQIWPKLTKFTKFSFRENFSPLGRYDESSFLCVLAGFLECVRILAIRQWYKPTAWKPKSRILEICNVKRKGQQKKWCSIFKIFYLFFSHKLIMARVSRLSSFLKLVINSSVIVQIHWSLWLFSPKDLIIKIRKPPHLDSEVWWRY